MADNNVEVFENIQLQTQFSTECSPLVLPPNSKASKSKVKSEFLVKDKIEEYVGKHFKIRECNRYIQSSTPDFCHCKRPKLWHIEHNAFDESETLEKWSVEKCTKISPCDCYGEIRLHGFGNLRPGHKPFFIRMDALERDFEPLYFLFTKILGLSYPDLILSIGGGAKNMTEMPKKMVKKIKTGLLNVAVGVKCTWIITSGFNVGILVIVAKAIQEYLAAGGRETELNVIGIGTWGSVHNNESLTNGTFKSNGRFRTYQLYNTPGLPGKGQADIEPNHTHFVLCDDGTYRSFNKEMDFRVQFEQFLVRKMKDLQNENKRVYSTPVVHIVVEGGKTAIMLAGKASNMGTPVVTIQGSGRAANEIAWAYEMGSKHNLKEKEEEFFAQLKKRLAKYKESWHCTETEMNEILNVLFKAGTDSSNFYSLFDAETEVDLEKTVLYTLFKHDDYKSNPATQLRLAMAWQRPDIAVQEIFAKRTIDKEKLNLKLLMKQALIGYQIEFVELFLDNGISMSQFLTEEVMEELYETTFHSETDNATRLNRKLESDATLTPDSKALLKANRLITLFTDYDIQDLYTNKENTVYQKNGKRVYSYQDMYFWALLNHKVPLALLFWKNGKDQIISALIGARILQKRAKDAEHHGEMELLSCLEEDAQLFEQLAVKLLTICHERNKDYILKILTRKLPYWNNKTVLELGVINESMDLLYLTSVQNILTKIWNSSIPTDRSTLKLLICIFLPFLIPVFIFKRKLLAKRQTPQIESESKSESAFNKVKHFYEAPRVKYTLNVLSTMFFLLCFSHLILVELQPLDMVCSTGGRSQKMPHWTELYVFIWAVSFIAEEVRQFCSKTLRIAKQMREYSVWDWTDLAITFSFILCFILRLTVPCVKFDWVRNVYAITLAMSYMRTMNFYYAHPVVGPKVVMVIHMVNDVVFFICILGIFTLSYGVASLSLLANKDGNVTKELSFNLVKNVFYRPYWQMYGELFLDDESEDGILQPDAAIGGSRNWLVVVLLAGYMLLSNVLLLNLLIAMFGNTFEKVHSSSHKFWAYIRHDLIYEYYKRPILPPPLISICHIWRLSKWIFRKCNFKFLPIEKDKNIFAMSLETGEHRQLSVLEQQATDHYYQEHLDDILSDKYKRKVTLDVLGEITTREHEKISLDTDHTTCEKLDERIRNLEQIVDTMSSNIEDIANAVQLYQKTITSFDL